MAVKRIPDTELGVAPYPGPGRRDGLYARRVKGQNLRLKLINNNHKNPIFESKERNVDSKSVANKTKDAHVDTKIVHTPKTRMSKTPFDYRAAPPAWRETGARLRECGDQFQCLYENRARQQGAVSTSLLVHMPLWARMTVLTGCVWLLLKTVAR